MSKQSKKKKKRSKKEQSRRLKVGFKPSSLSEHKNYLSALILSKHEVTFSCPVKCTERIGVRPTCVLQTFYQTLVMPNLPLKQENKKTALSQMMEDALISSKKRCVWYLQCSNMMHWTGESPDHMIWTKNAEISIKISVENRKEACHRCSVQQYNWAIVWRR